MALSEIEKLERRYAENPQGLTFAPLAEVHRKNGDVARALELLRPGLTLHPDYIPASIVLGRCHLDLGDLPAAEAAFSHVLSLDGENVIALKALADITERLYRFDEAERWLRTLLAIDRSNDEARDQLGRVETARRQAETASPAAPESSAASAPALEERTAAVEAAEPESAEPRGAAEPSTPPDVSAPPMPEPPRAPMLAWIEEPGSAGADEAAPLELEELDLAGGAEASPPEGIELEQPVTLEEPVEPLSGLVGREDRPTEAAHEDLSDGWQVETAEDIVLQSSGGSEFQVANAAEELLSGSGASPHESDPLLPERPPLEKGEPSAQPSAPVAEPVAEAAGDELVAAEQPEPVRYPEPDLVITESMASLLLEQGHRVEALTVYRHLERRTGDVRLQEKIAELERAGVGSSPAPAAAESAAASRVPAAAPAYSVRETKGQSIQAFLRGLFTGRLPAPPAAVPAHGDALGSAPPEAAAGGAPTRPAHDSLSLSSVFGEDAAPVPPAVPAAGSAAPAPGGVSYDEFFGGAGGGPARPSRAPDAKSDDLDQFHAWLQNLKR